MVHRQKELILVVLFFVLIDLFLFRDLLINGATLGIRSDWPIPPLARQIEDQVENDVFRIWTTNFLGYERNRQAGNYVDIAMLFLLRLFDLSGSHISKYPILLIILTGPLTFLTFKKIGLKSLPALVGALFYTHCVPFLYDSLINGYLKFTVSYMALPPFIYFLYKEYEKNDRKFYNWIMFTLFFVLLSTALNFFFIGFIPIVTFGLIDYIKQKDITKTLISAAKIAVSAILVISVQATAFFIPIYDLTHPTQGAPVNALKEGLITFLTFSHPTTFSAYRLFGVADNYFERSYPSRQFPNNLKLYGTFVMYGLSIITLIVYAGSNFKKHKSIPYITLLTIVCLFIFKGVNPPFSYLNNLFYHIPIMSVLRNISYITILLGLCYSLLVAFALELLWEKFSRIGLIKIGLPLAITFMLIVGAYPIWEIKILSEIKPYKPDEHTVELYNKLKNEPSHFYVLNIPTLSPFYYTDSQRNIIGPGFSPFINNPPKPTIISNIVKYNKSHYITAYVHNLLTYQVIPETSALMNLLNLKYITINKNFESAFPQFINLQSNKWYKSITSVLNLDNKLSRNRSQYTPLNESISILENSRHEDSTVLTTEGVFLNAGGYDSYQIVSNLFGIKYPTGIFADDYVEELDSLVKLVVFQQHGIDNLTIGFIPQEYKYQPGNFLDRNRNLPTKEWTPIYHGQYWWYDPILTNVYESIMIFDEGKLKQFTLPVNLNSDVKYLVFANLLHSPNGGEVEISIEDKTLGYVGTYDPNNKYFMYTKVGEFYASDTQQAELNITAIFGNTNVVQNIVVVPEQIYLSAAYNANNMLSDTPYIFTLEFDNFTGLGISNPATHFYYSISDKPKFQYTFTLDVPFPGVHEIWVSKKEAIGSIIENLTTNYFEPVKPNKPIEQLIDIQALKAMPPDFAELCIPYTYIEANSLIPSARTPEDNLMIELFDGDTNDIIFGQMIRPQRVYSEGDWLYTCIDFDIQKINGNKVKVVVKSNTNKRLYAISALINHSEKSYTIKYSLKPYYRNTPATVSVASGRSRLVEKINSDKHLTKIGKLSLQKGPNEITIECTTICNLDKLALTSANLDMETIKAGLESTPLGYTTQKGESYLIEPDQLAKEIIVLKQGYSASWDITETKTRSHFFANGFHNGWIMANDHSVDTENMKIEFRKVKIYRIANTVSFAILTLIIGSAIISYAKRHTKH